MNEIYPVEFDAPDIAPYKQGNSGVDYVTTFDSGQPGPHAMIQAVTHGNETCGAHAVDHLFRNDVRPKRGKLTLAFVAIGLLHASRGVMKKMIAALEQGWERVV